MALSPELPAVSPVSGELPEPSAQFEGEYLFKQAVKVNMNNTSRISIQQNVLAMPIPKPTTCNLEFINDK
jgi:hypothetical protein